MDYRRAYTAMRVQMRARSESIIPDANLLAGMTCLYNALPRARVYLDEDVSGKMKNSSSG